MSLKETTYERYSISAISHFYTIQGSCNDCVLKGLNYVPWVLRNFQYRKLASVAPTVPCKKTRFFGHSLCK